MNRLMQAAQGLLGNVQREPGYIYGDILPVRAQVNQQGQVIPGSREWGLGYSNAARGLLDAFTLPGRAIAGEQVTPQQAMEMAMNVTAPGVATARYTPGLLNMPMVYHGTPHRFEPTPDNPLGEFRASQIGTGEGAQAYGHGIYVAEEKETAKKYKEALEGANYAFVDGEPVRNNFALTTAISAKHSGRDPEKFLKRMIYDENQYELAKALLPKVQKMNTYFGPFPGSLYTADLPDEMVDRMLDWDKPLSEQPEAVQKALKTAWPDIEEYSAKSGEKLYQELSMPTFKSTPTSGMNRAEAAAWLRQAGIPGIKYLDAGSRGDKAKSTRNFVLFPGEEKKAKIIKRE